MGVRAVPNENLLSANLILCESVLTEATGTKTAVRMVNFFTIPYAGNPLIHFFALSFLTCRGPDTSRHVAKVDMVEITSGVPVAEAPEHPFFYGFAPDIPNGPGAFSLSTEFNLDTSKVRVPSPYLVRLRLNGVVEGQTLLMLRR